MTLDFPASRGTFAPLRRDFFVKTAVSTGFLRKNACVPCTFMVCYARKQGIDWEWT